MRNGTFQLGRHMKLKVDGFRLQGRLPFRPRDASGRAPPKIPKCVRTRLACSFGGTPSMLSQSRMKGDGGSARFGGDGESPAVLFTGKHFHSTSGGFRL